MLPHAFSIKFDSSKRVVQFIAQTLAFVMKFAGASFLENFFVFGTVNWKRKTDFELEFDGEKRQ